MKVYPIDKPTKPGHYWFWSIDGHEWQIHHVYEYDGYLKVDLCKTVEQVTGGQWHGPAIEYPYVTREQPTAPRRFRWRDGSEEGEGVAWTSGYVDLESVPKSRGCPAFFRSVVELHKTGLDIIWIDPPPEPPKDGWDNLIEVLDHFSWDRKQTGDCAKAAHYKSALDNMLPTLKEKCPLP